MPLRSVIEIDVNDDAFKAFQMSFEKYQKALENMPSFWSKTNTALAGGKEPLIAMGSLLVAAFETLHKVNREAENFHRQTDGTTRSMGHLARNTRDVARHISEATKSLLRWTGITTAVGGLLGVGGGLFGIERLAESAGRTRSSAMGLGLRNTGLMQGLGIQFGPFGDVRGSLSRTAAAQQDVQQAWIFNAMGIPGARNAAPDKALIQEMRAARKLYQQTPRQQRQQALEAHGFLNVLPMETIRALAGMSDREFEGRIQHAQDFAQKSGMTPDMLKAWQDFTVKMHEAGTSIENTFITALQPLTPSLERLVKSFEDVVLAFGKSETVKHWIEVASDGLEEFSHWIDSPDFKKDVGDFVTGVGDLATSIKHALQLLGLVGPDSKDGKPGQPGLIAQHPWLSIAGAYAGWQALKGGARAAGGALVRGAGNIVGAGARAATGAVSGGGGLAGALRFIPGIGGFIAGMWPGTAGSQKEIEDEKRLGEQARAAAKAAKDSKMGTTGPKPTVDKDQKPSTADNKGQSNPLGDWLRGKIKGVLDPSSAASPAKTGPSGGGPAPGFYIKKSEGFASRLYNDVGHPAIGYGHDLTPAELRSGVVHTSTGDVSTRGKITKAQADAIFAIDYDQRYKQVLKRVPALANLNANQREAVMSYYYNTGRLPRGLSENLGRGDLGAVDESILHGIHTVHGQSFAPLVRRRREEAELFNRPITPSSTSGVETVKVTPPQPNTPAHVHVNIHNNTGGSAVVSTSQVAA